jgi:hypothetical protein
MSESGPFDGFMPLITDITISRPSASITSNGDLVDVHSIRVKTLEKEYVFSMRPEDLHRLYFLVLKCLM